MVHELKLPDTPGPPDPAAADKYPKVIAVDPGNTTGIAACTLLPNIDDAPKYRVFPEGFSSIEVPDGIDGFSAFFADVLSPQIVGRSGSTVFVVERFNIDQRTVKQNVQYHALYIIGFLAGMHGLGNLIFRSPSQRRVAKGKLYEWSNPSKDNHADDAAMHLKSYLVDVFPYLMEPLLLPPTDD